jgi:hypothetical protein
MGPREWFANVDEDAADDVAYGEWYTGGGAANGGVGMWVVLAVCAFNLDNQLTALFQQFNGHSRVQLHLAPVSRVDSMVSMCAEEYLDGSVGVIAGRRLMSGITHLLELLVDSCFASWCSFCEALLDPCSTKLV